MRNTFGALKGAFSMKRRRSALLIGVVVVVCSTALTACNTKDVYSSPDSTMCIYDKEDGRLIKQLPPGADSVEVEDDAIEVKLPTSDRFGYVTPDDAKRDPGFPKYMTGTDSTYKDIGAYGQVKFQFDQNQQCAWYEQNGKRNADENGNLGFNTRGDPNTGWATWLAENLAPAMQRTMEPILRKYDWAHLVYNYPVNASERGDVPDGEEPGMLTRDAVAEEFNKNFSAELSKSIGGQYFCGIAYDSAKPDVCPNIQIYLDGFVLYKDDSPLKQRQELEQIAENNRYANERAALIEQGIDAETREKQAQTDRDNALAEIEKTDKLADQARERALLEDQQLTDALNAQQAATEDLSACAEAAKLNGGVISPEDCARILLALEGLSPNVAGDGLVISGK